MKNILISILCSIFYLQSNAQNPVLNWVKNVGATGKNCTTNEIASDNSGNVYAGGYFSGTQDFGNGNLTAAGLRDIFLAKYNSAGNCIWAFNIGGTSTSNVSNNDVLTSIAADEIGNVYITGVCFGSNINFSPLGDLSGTDIYLNNGFFIAKYNPDGLSLWAKVLTYQYSPEFVVPKGIAVDTMTDFLYVTGYFKGLNVDFDYGPGSTLLSSNGADQNSFGNNDIFLAKYNKTNGDFIWVINAGGSGNNDIGNSVTIDKNNNVYIAGSFEGSNIDFDAGISSNTISSAGNQDGFIAEYDSSAAFMWAFPIGGIFNDNVFSISSDQYNNLYSTGHFTGINVNFNPLGSANNISNYGLANHSNAFAAKYNNSGICQWAFTMGSASSVSETVGNSITSDKSENVYITGYFTGVSAMFNPANTGTILNATPGTSNSFVARYDINGQYKSAFPLGGYSASNESGLSIATDASGHVYTGGYLSSNGIDFDPGSSVYNVNVIGSRDLYIAQYCTSSDIPQITSSVNPVCAGSESVLAVDGTPKLYGADHWQWYSGSCGGTAIGTGLTMAINPVISGTYFVTGEGGCISQPVNCASVSITVTTPVNPSVSLHLQTGTTYLCSQNNLDLIAVPVNPGTSPSYRWFKNGVLIPLANAFTLNGGSVTNYSEGDIITVEMTSSINCVTNSIAIGNYIVPPTEISVPVSVSISVGPYDDVCSNFLTFTAVPVNGGTHPVYLWLKNGNPFTGTESENSITASGFNYGDVVTCYLYSSIVCANPEAALSNSLVLTGNAPNGPVIYVNQFATGNNDGTSWNDAFYYLDDALNEAKYSVVPGFGSAQIWVAQGTYYPSYYPSGCIDCFDSRDYSYELSDNIGVYGGFDGTENSLCERNVGNHPTILSGNINDPFDESDNCYHVILSLGNNNSAVLDGFTVREGIADNDVDAASIGPYLVYKNMGSGIYMSGSDTKIRNCILTTNRSNQYGGGVYFEQCNLPIISSCIFDNNNSEYGGGVYLNNSGATISNCVFINNITSGFGPALYNTGVSSTVPSVINSTFSLNIGGGTVSNVFGSAIHLSNCIIWNNNPSSSPVYDVHDAFTFPPLIDHSFIQGGFIGSGNSSLNPLFSNPSNPIGTDNIWRTSDDGLKLSVSTPALNMATLLNAPVTDITGFPRPFGLGAEPGAYEFSTSRYDATVSISANPGNIICHGTSVTFSITVTGSSSGDSFEWLLNNVVVASGTTYTTTTLNNLDVVVCRMNITNPLANNPVVTSAPIGMTVYSISGNIVYVNADASGTNSGNNWANAFTDLQKGIDAASICGTHQVWVAQGIYKPNSLPAGCSVCSGARDYAFTLQNNVVIYGGFIGNETTLSQRNFRINKTILDGDIGVAGNNSDNSYHVIVSVLNDATAKLDGFIITNGNASEPPYVDMHLHGETVYRDWGGGIVNVNSSPDIINCIFTNNHSTTWGGGLFNSYSASLIENCIFSGNTSESGGAIANWLESTPLIINSVFTNNIATFGGAIKNLSSSSPTILNSTFSNNSAGNGSALSNTFNSSPIITNCILWGNTGSSENILNQNSNCIPVINYSLIQGSFSGTGNINYDPLFINASDPDGSDNIFGNTDDGLKLQPCSPAIDNGTTLTATVNDITSISRPLGLSYDMGAYEMTPVPVVYSTQIFVNANSHCNNPDGSQWSRAFSDLQQGINKAAELGISQVWVAGGTYYPSEYPEGCTNCNFDNERTFTLKNGIAIYGGFQGNENVLSQRNLGENNTFLDGGNQDFYHIIVCVNLDNSAVLDGFVIQNGFAYCNCGSLPTQSSTVQGADISWNQGGGIFIYNASPVIRNCILYSNRGGSGGGIFNVNASPKIINCVFKGNDADFGGGIYNLNSNPDISNCTFTGSSFSSGIHNNNSNPIIKNCLLWGNESHSGIQITNETSNPSVSYSLIQNGYPGFNIISADPLFNGLGDPLGPDNKWATRDDGLLFPCNSPARNAGSNTGVASTDIKGDDRIIDGTTDIGAYEFNYTFPSGIVYVDADATGCNSGADWANAITDLSEALEQSIREHATQVWVAEGTYKPTKAPYGCTNCGTERDFAFKLADNLSILGGFSGTENFASERLPLIHPTILSGNIGTAGSNTDNVYHVVVSPHNSNTALLDGCTIQDGYNFNVSNLSPFSHSTIDGEDIYRFTGAGIVLMHSSANISNCVFSHNEGNDGGAVYNGYLSAQFSNCTFSENNAKVGAGIYNVFNSAQYSNCNFTTNGSASTISGGGMYNNNSAISLSNCNFKVNDAQSGGGIYNFRSHYIIPGSILENNHAQKGAAIYNEESHPDISKCIIIDNTADVQGGGIYNDVTSTPAIRNCILSGNSAVNGSAIYNFTYSEPKIANNTICNNTASSGGTIFNEGAFPQITNCIIWNNSDGIVNAGSATTDITYSIIQGGYAGTGNIDLDPKFINPSDPDGPDNLWRTTDDGFIISCSSPAMNSGRTPFPFENALSLLIPTNDINGNLRPQVGAFDMGAYEIFNPVLTITANPGTTTPPHAAVFFDAVSSPWVTSATYTWIVDGTMVTTGGSTFSYSDWGNGPTDVYCLMSDGTCTATSNHLSIHTDHSIFALSLSFVTGVVSSPICPGTTFMVPFSSSGFPAGTTFTAQISNNVGSFISPVIIGSTALTSGNISCNIPVSVPGGNRYRIRVVASPTSFAAPDNGSDLIVNPVFTFFADADADHYSSGLNVITCTRPLNGFLVSELIAITGDCDDNDVLINPAAMEICGNAIDENCDGIAETCSGIITLNLHLFIQGFYLGSGIMTPVLANSGMSTDMNVCDNIQIDLRDPLSLESSLLLVNAMLDINGNASIIIPPALLNSTCYIIIRHRNSIETWSKMPVLLAGTVEYDFR